MRTATLDSYAGTCRHCANPLGGIEGAFCCAGCARVHAILEAEGLGRYYDLRGAAPGLPAPPEQAESAWLAPLEARLEAAAGLTRLEVDVQGVHCAACVWLLEAVFARQPGGKSCVVNPSRGRIRLAVEPSFDLRRWADAVRSVGYAIGPALEGAALAGSARSDALTLRMGLSVALAANAMMVSLALYFGLTEGRLHDVARELAFALGVATVVVGGGVFVKSAWQSLRRGLVHLDLPIAVGIGLATVGSTWSFFGGGDGPLEPGYFDTVAVFVALMLVGRWLQERVVAQNRARLLKSDGTLGLWSRRLERDGPKLVRCTELAPGDTLFLAAGDLVPVDAVLAAAASLRLDWIDGESEPRRFEAGAIAPAGAFLASGGGVQATCVTDLASSPLTGLLRAPLEREASSPLTGRIAGLYVAGVLAAAAGAFALWMMHGTFDEAVRVTTAVLVVTCPCAFGIAAPLAWELAQSHLRRRGLFVRDAGLLRRLPGVRRAVFDKTGTLTTGKPRLVDAAALDALDDEERAVLHGLAARSTHPKSLAVLDALDAPFDPSLVALEAPSCGMQTQRGGHRFRLGAPEWAAPEHRPEADLVFARDGRPIVWLETEEALRPDAQREVAALLADGLEVWILSGDSVARTRAMAARLGLPEERAIGGQRPEDKAEWLRAHAPEETLFVGDGINDGPAAEVALASGTPAIDRPFMPARSDFYFVTAGLAPVRELLLEARRLARVVRGCLAFAVVYNLGAVALAYAGLVEPWVAAVLMPISSVVTLAGAALAMRAPVGRSRWRS